MSDHWQDRVLQFWFGLTPSQWFGSDPALDDRVRELFHDLWSRKRELPADAFQEGPRAALAAVILFDQLPRNIFRGRADQFSTDHLALKIASGAVERGFDESLSTNERAFLYLPFEHSEKLADQERAVLLFTAPGDPRYLDYARKHRDIIERFGRFPHRNAMLGRAPRADEIAAGNVNPF